MGETKLMYSQVPLMMYEGYVTLQTSGGKVVTQLLDTHDLGETSSEKEVRVGTADLLKMLAIESVTHAANNSVILSKKIVKQPKVFHSLQLAQYRLPRFLMFLRQKTEARNGSLKWKEPKNTNTCASRNILRLLKCSAVFV